MCSDRPLMSLIIPAYNAAATLPATLDSVLSQEFSDYEVIVVDDASTDTTVDVVRSFISRFSGRLKILRQGVNGGAARAYNRGLAEACGRYIGRCDADDLIPEGSFSAVADVLAGGDNPGIVWGGYYRGDKYVAPPQFFDLNSFSIDVDHFSLWNKWTRFDLAIGPYEGLDCWDDLAAVARILAVKPTIKPLNRPIYRYLIQPAGRSLSTSNQMRQLNHHLEVAQRLDRWFVEHGLAVEYEPFLLHLKFAAKVKLLRCKPRRLARWKAVFPEVNDRIMQLKTVPLHYRLIFALARMLPEAVGERLLNLF